MKLLLTSAGVNNPSIRAALLELLGKPIAESNALCIPTAGYGHPEGNRLAGVWRFISGNSNQPMVELGWKSVGVLELTSLPSIERERWLPWVREADVLLVNGGDALYLAHWMRESGLAELLPSLDAVWLGFSAGSMVMAPRVGADFIGWKPPSGSDEALGFVDFAICPHVNGDDQARQHPGRSRKLGCRHRRARLRSRRRDRLQGRRRHRRDHLRGSLDAVQRRAPGGLGPSLRRDVPPCPARS